MTCWGNCKSESEFYSIFGDQPVPIRSIVPIIPREEGSPPCYVVLGEKLGQAQVNALAEKLLNYWSPECRSIEQARQYILDGLPLKTSHFNGCSSDDFFMMPWGAALNASIHFAYIESQERENHS